MLTKNTMRQKINSLKRLIHIILKDRTHNSYIQFFRYFFVGGTAFVVDTGIFKYLTDYKDIYYVISATIGFIAGIIVNYILSTIWVFHRKNGELSKKQHLIDISIFSIIGIMGYLLTLAILWLFLEQLGFSTLSSKIVAGVIVLFWNFLGRKYLVFHKNDNR